jgi:hypothetical protein
MTTPPNTNPTAAVPPQRRGRFQYSLRTLMLVVTVVAIFMGWVAKKRRESALQEAAFDAIVAAGGFIAGVDFVPFDTLADVECPIERFPNWWERLLGHRRFVVGTFAGSSRESLPYLRNFPAIKRLSIKSPGLSEDDLNQIECLQELCLLTIDSPSVAHAGYRKLAAHKKLNDITLEGCTLTDDDLFLFRDHDNMTSFACRGPITDTGIKHIAHWTHLQSLNIDDCKLSGDGIAVIAHLTQLKYLNLNGAQVRDADLDHLLQLRKLRGFSLSGSKIQGHNLSMLNQLPKLIGLNIAQTDLDDEGLAEIGKLHRLEFLDAQNTKITYDGLAKLQTEFPMLIIIHSIPFLPMGQSGTKPPAATLPADSPLPDENTQSTLPEQNAPTSITDP